MDISILPYNLNTIIVGFCAILIVSYFLSSRKWGVGNGREPSKANMAPEASGGWPIFGHLPLLKGPTPTHKTLGALADQYGPIFTVRLGSHRGLVVSSSEIAKECYTINDLSIASRPNMLIGKHIGYNNAMFAFAPYGPYWREIRKIATLELLSNRRLELLKHIRLSEVGIFLKGLHKRWTNNVTTRNNNDVVLVELKQMLWDLNLNVILRMIAGKVHSSDNINDFNGRCGNEKESRRVQRAIKEFLDLFGAFVPGDVIPSLRWLDLWGYEKAMKKTGDELDGILTEWLEEHKRKDESGNEHDFMDVMLSLLHGSDLAGYEADSIIKATSLNLIAGGSDTTTGTLVWAISLLLNNRHELKKAQEELESHVGKNRLVNEFDITNLAYIQSIVKETLRLYPVAPLAGPRVFNEDCTISGYYVTRGTRLITNLWKIQTDLNAWPNPLEFKPERFLTTHKETNVRGQHFELFPFGSGRRACPATNFALEMVHFTLASFLHAFEITTPSNAPVDMTESFGVTNMKATPLEILITPRLCAKLYG